MTSTPGWVQVPDGWPPVSDDTLAHAKQQALAALADTGNRPVRDRLIDYYDLTGNYVGASFTELVPNEWSDITAADLHATSLMNVKIGPRATRRLLSGPERQWALASLRRLPDTSLALADPRALEAMYDFYSAAKHAVSNPDGVNPNPWVTASKFCARKRPELFPVRDRVVCDYLGIRGLKDVRADWQVFRALVQDGDIQRALNNLLHSVHQAADGRTVVLEGSDLRILDAALWTYAVKPAAQLPDEE